MGCDIHCYIEHKRVGTEHWWSYGGRINPGRNYAVFERLAGVRGDDAQAIAPPRGLPERLAWNAHGDQWLFITDDSESEEYASTEEAARYVKHGGTYLYQDGTDKPPTHVSAPDWHSHSWVTPDEWQTAISTARYEVGVEYRAMLASMRAMEREGHEVRVVFWFDN